MNEKDRGVYLDEKITEHRVKEATHKSKKAIQKSKTKVALAAVVQVECQRLLGQPGTSKDSLADKINNDLV